MIFYHTKDPHTTLYCIIIITTIIIIISMKLAGLLTDTHLWLAGRAYIGQNCHHLSLVWHPSVWGEVSCITEYGSHNQCHIVWPPQRPLLKTFSRALFPLIFIFRVSHSIGNPIVETKCFPCESTAQQDIAEKVHTHTLCPPPLPCTTRCVLCRVQAFQFILFRCHSFSLHLPLSVSEWVSQWVMFSDFGDSYRIYRACELVFDPTRRKVR